MIYECYSGNFYASFCFSGTLALNIRHIEDDDVRIMNGDDDGDDAATEDDDDDEDDYVYDGNAC